MGKKCTDTEGAMNWESLGTSGLDRLIGGKTTASTVKLMRLHTDQPKHFKSMFTELVQIMYNLYC